MTNKTPPYPEGHELLAGKNVLITAAAGAGIGFAAAKRSVEEGARVFISDVHPERTAQAAESLSALSRDAVGHLLCDVTREEDVQ
ncbi:MAG: SDR family NAD(P)-dependent oxidoreductase, partial [Myxococcota bacterium]